MPRHSSYDIYLDGIDPCLVFIEQADQWTGTRSLGFTGNAFHIAFDVAPDRIFAPIGTLTWNKKTLAQVGVTAYTLLTVVYTTSNGEEVLFATAVPEPSSSAFLAVSAALG